MKDLGEMTPDEVHAEALRRNDRRRKNLPLHETVPSADTLRRIAEEDDRLEKEIQRDVVKLYTAFGCVVFNLSQARASKQTPGLGDLYVVHLTSMQVWWHETKTPTGKQSPAQREFENIHRDTAVGYVVGGVLAAEEQFVQLRIALRGSNGQLEGIR